MTEFTVTIAGRRYRLVYRRMRTHDGECDQPRQTRKEIRIDPRVIGNSQRHMEVVLHEALHASGWWIDEEFVEQYARAAARLLHRLGFERREGD